MKKTATVAIPAQGAAIATTVQNPIFAGFSEEQLNAPAPGVKTFALYLANRQAAKVDPSIAKRNDWHLQQPPLTLRECLQKTAEFNAISGYVKPVKAPKVKKEKAAPKSTAKPSQQGVNPAVTALIQAGLKGADLVEAIKALNL